MLEWSVRVSEDSWCTQLLDILTNRECSKIQTADVVRGLQKMDDYMDDVYMANMVCDGVQRQRKCRVLVHSIVINILTNRACSIIRTEDVGRGPQ